MTTDIQKVATSLLVVLQTVMSALKGEQSILLPKDTIKDLEGQEKKLLEIIEPTKDGEENSSVEDRLERRIEGLCKSQHTLDKVQIYNALTIASLEDLEKKVESIDKRTVSAINVRDHLNEVTSRIHVLEQNIEKEISDVTDISRDLDSVLGKIKGLEVLSHGHKEDSGYSPAIVKDRLSSLDIRSANAFKEIGVNGSALKALESRVNDIEKQKLPRMGDFLFDVGQSLSEHIFDSDKTSPQASYLARVASTFRYYNKEAPDSSGGFGIDTKKGSVNTKIKFYGEGSPSKDDIELILQHIRSFLENRPEPGDVGLSATEKVRQATTVVEKLETLIEEEFSLAGVGVAPQFEKAKQRVSETVNFLKRLIASEQSFHSDIPLEDKPMCPVCGDTEDVETYIRELEEKVKGFEGLYKAKCEEIEETDQLATERLKTIDQLSCHITEARAKMAQYKRVPSSLRTYMKRLEDSELSGGGEEIKFVSECLGRLAENLEKEDFAKLQAETTEGVSYNLISVPEDWSETDPVARALRRIRWLASIGQVDLEKVPGEMIQSFVSEEYDKLNAAISTKVVEAEDLILAWKMSDGSVSPVEWMDRVQICAPLDRREPRTGERVKVAVSSEGPGGETRRISELAEELEEKAEDLSCLSKALEKIASGHLFDSAEEAEKWSRDIAVSALAEVVNGTKSIPEDEQIERLPPAVITPDIIGLTIDVERIIKQNISLAPKDQAEAVVHFLTSNEPELFPIAGTDDTDKPSDQSQQNDTQDSSEQTEESQSAQGTDRDNGPSDGQSMPVVEQLRDIIYTLDDMSGYDDPISDQFPEIADALEKMVDKLEKPSGEIAERVGQLAEFLSGARQRAWPDNMKDVLRPGHVTKDIDYVIRELETLSVQVRDRGFGPSTAALDQLDEFLKDSGGKATVVFLPLKDNDELVEIIEDVKKGKADIHSGRVDENSDKNEDKSSVLLVDDPLSTASSLESVSEEISDTDKVKSNYNFRCIKDDSDFIKEFASCLNTLAIRIASELDEVPAEMWGLAELLKKLRSKQNSSVSDESTCKGRSEYVQSSKKEPVDEQRLKDIEQLGFLRNQNEALRCEIDHHISRCETFRTQNGNLRQDCYDLRQDCDDLRKEIKALEEKVEAKTSRISALTEELEKALSHLSEVEIDVRRVDFIPERLNSDQLKEQLQKLEKKDLSYKHSEPTQAKLEKSYRAEVKDIVNRHIRHIVWMLVTGICDQREDMLASEYYSSDQSEELDLVIDHTVDALSKVVRIEIAHGGHSEKIGNSITIECPKCGYDDWASFGVWKRYSNGVECPNCGFYVRLHFKEVLLKLKELRELCEVVGGGPIDAEGLSESMTGLVEDIFELLEYASDSKGDPVNDFKLLQALRDFRLTGFSEKGLSYTLRQLSENLSMNSHTPSPVDDLVNKLKDIAEYVGKIEDASAC